MGSKDKTAVTRPPFPKRERAYHGQKHNTHAANTLILVHFDKVTVLPVHSHNSSTRLPLLAAQACARALNRLCFLTALRYSTTEMKTTRMFIDYRLRNAVYNIYSMLYAALHVQLTQLTPTHSSAVLLIIHHGPRSSMLHVHCQWDNLVNRASLKTV